MSLLKTLHFIVDHPVNHTQRFKSIVRFAKWQILGRLLSGSFVFEWVNDSKFFARIGETGITGNIYTGLHEFQDMGYLLHVLRTEDFFVDVGANVGSYSILAGAAIGAKGVSIEPIPKTYQRLIENIRLNRIEERVKTLNKGVGARAGNCLFSSDSDTTNHALVAVEGKYDAVTVEMTTLDAVLYDEYPMFLKVDVEGFEVPVLEGAQETLKKKSLNSVLIELNGIGSRYGYDDARAIDILANFGFEPYSYNPIDRMVKKLKGKNLSAGNTLFLRDKRFIQERLFSAHRFSVYGREF